MFLFTKKYRELYMRSYIIIVDDINKYNFKNLSFAFIDCKNIKNSFERSHF